MIRERNSADIMTIECAVTTVTVSMGADMNLKRYGFISRNGIGRDI